MSGQWTDLWDADATRWRRVWIDVPEAKLVITSGSVTNVSEQDSECVIVGSDGRPLLSQPTKRRVGF